MRMPVATRILIVGFIIIIIKYISMEFIFEEKRLNEISENKFSSKITRYTVLLRISFISKKSATKKSATG